MMKVVIKEQAESTSPQVIIETAKIDAQITQLVRYIEHFDQRIPAYDENRRQIQVYINEILYIESVDKKTFLYTHANILETDARLYELETQFREADLVRISKSMIVNIQKITSIQPLFSARAQIIVENGEKLIISRQYFKQLKTHLLRQEE